MIIAADPYPWPYDGRLEAHRTALLIAGAQPAWFDRSVGAGEVGEVIDAVAVAVRAAGGLVVHLRHGRSGRRRTLVPLPPSPGAAAWRLLTPPEPGDLVVDAMGVDGFYGSCLDEELRAAGVDCLVLTGYGAEAPVSSTLRSANDRGYECLTLVDAVAPFDERTGRHTLASITMSGGIFGALACAADLLAVLPAFIVPTVAEAIS